MAISTNSIIHYTSALSRLKLILKEGLSIKYCSERLKIESSLKSAAAHPMISFCDIPLSQSYMHFNAYGRYGIGLTKKWANRNGVNPVLYLDTNSSISKTIGAFIKERRSKESNLTPTQASDILRIKCFTKNYAGPLKRKDINTPNYRFYDEREWRFVPERQDLDGAPFSVDMGKYERNKTKYNERISHLRITFEASEIAYIIVDRTAEIPEIIKTLKRYYSEKNSSKALGILISKVCSTEQILSDY